MGQVGDKVKDVQFFISMYVYSEVGVAGQTT